MCLWLSQVFFLKNDLKALIFLLLRVALLLSRCAYRKKICFVDSSFLSSYIYGLFSASKEIKVKTHKYSTYISCVRCVSLVLELLAKVF